MNTAYGIGLDIGIASVGWAVVALNEDAEPYGLIRCGSRVFDKAEQPKTGDSLAASRREARSTRRRLRRRSLRKADLYALMEKSGLPGRAAVEEAVLAGHLPDIYALRAQALDGPVTAMDFARILLHLMQRRGFRSNRKADDAQKDGKLLQAIDANTQRMKDNHYRTVGEMMYRDPAFATHKRNKNENYLSTVRRDQIASEAAQLFAAQRQYGAAWASPETEAEYLTILTRQRSFDEGPGGNSPYGGNMIEKMVGTCTLEGTAEPRAAKATWSFEYFTLLQKLNHIRIEEGGNSHPLTHAQRQELLALCYQTDMQYWNTVARAELLQVATDYRNSIASLTKTIRERVEAGLVDPQDLLMAEVKLNEAEYQLLQAKSSLETGRMALNSLIGTALHEITEVEDTIPSIVMNEQLWKQDGSNRPELKIAYDQIGIAESSKKLTDSKYKPQLYVGIEGSYSSPGYNFKSDLDPNYAVYAKLSVPIFEWGKRRNEKRAASFQIGAATDNLHQVSDHVNLEVQTARVSLSQAMEQVQLTRNSLEKARKNEQMALERYTEGKVSIVEMIEAQNYRQISQTNYVQAKVSAQGHYSALLKALNKY